MNRFRPHVTVACVIQAERRFLLVEEQIDGHSVFNQPAGHIEAGESLLNACQREVEEETGLSIAPQALLGIYQWRARSGIEFLRFCFVVDLPKILHVQPLDPQITACHWLTDNEIKATKQQHRSSLVQQAINDYHQGQFTPLSVLSNQL